MAKKIKKKNLESTTSSDGLTIEVKPGRVRLRAGFTIVINSKVFEGPMDLDVDEKTFFENEHKFETVDLSEDAAEFYDDQDEQDNNEES